MGVVYKINESISIEDGASPTSHEDIELKALNDRVKVFLSEFGEDQGSDIPLNSDDTEAMSDVNMDQIDKKLSGIEDRMDKRVERIERETDRRSAEFRREIEIREVAFKNEQALRDRSLDERFSSFLAVQTERDKAQIERDKRFEMLAERVTVAAEGAEEAAKQAATVKANYWAAVAVQLLAVVAILVGAYYANQANVFGAMQTTMSAYQAGKDTVKPTESPQAPPAK